MKKRLLFMWLLLVATPVIFSSEAIVSAKVEECDSFDDFNIEELELALDEAGLAEQELVKPPSPWVVWFRRIFSPVGVALIKLCDAIRDGW